MTVHFVNIDIVVPEVVFVARMNVAGSPIRTRKANAGIDRYITVLSLEERKGQGKAKLLTEYYVFPYALYFLL